MTCYECAGFDEHEEWCPYYDADVDGEDSNHEGELLRRVPYATPDATSGTPVFQLSFSET